MEEENSPSHNRKRETPKPHCMKGNSPSHNGGTEGRHIASAYFKVGQIRPSAHADFQHKNMK